MKPRLTAICTRARQSRVVPHLHETCAYAWRRICRGKGYVGKTIGIKLLRYEDFKTATRDHAAFAHQRCGCHPAHGWLVSQARALDKRLRLLGCGWGRSSQPMREQPAARGASGCSLHRAKPVTRTIGSTPSSKVRKQCQLCRWVVKLDWYQLVTRWCRGAFLPSGCLRKK